MIKLRYSELENINADSEELITFHRNVLLNKKLINNVFREFYSTCYDLYQKYKKCDGDPLIIEIGSGSSLFKHYYPEIISTDIKKHEYNDMTLDAQDMQNVEDGSVDAFMAINCFHHFPAPDKFFEQIIQKLKCGGTCVIIEPYYGFLSKFLYSRMFETESFDKKQQNWDYIVKGPMSGANQALSYIVFERDRDILLEKYPEIEIVHKRIFNNYLRYLFSGGLNFIQLVPDFMEGPLKVTEALMKFVNKHFGLHHVVVIRKR